MFQPPILAFVEYILQKCNDATIQLKKMQQLQDLISILLHFFMQQLRKNAQLNFNTNKICSGKILVPASILAELLPGTNLVREFNESLTVA